MSRRRANRRPVRGVSVPVRHRAARPLVQTAMTKFRHSASSLISTVLADTSRVRHQTKPTGRLKSPWLLNRAIKRVARIPFSYVKEVFPIEKNVPKRALVCATRSIRREVLFATRQTGRGSMNPVRRYSESSKEKC